MSAHRVMDFDIEILPRNRGAVASIMALWFCLRRFGPQTLQGYQVCWCAAIYKFQSLANISMGPVCVRGGDAASSNWGELLPQPAQGRPQRTTWWANHHVVSGFKDPGFFEIKISSNTAGETLVTQDPRWIPRKQVLIGFSPSIAFLIR